MSHRLSLVALACLGLGAAPAAAASVCGVVAPRYQPKADHSSQTQPAQYPGGARLHQPVARPCPSLQRPVDV